jgi:hypothetical protein
MTPFIEPMDWDWNMDQMEAYEYQRDAEIIEGDMVLCDGVWYVVDEIEWDMMPDSDEWYRICYCSDEDCLDVVLSEGMIESVDRSMRSVI